MGLDQSIYTKIYQNQFSGHSYVSTYDELENISKVNYEKFCKVAELIDFEDLVDLSNPDHYLSFTLDLELIYLRKCYPIHYWIISRSYAPSAQLDPFSGQFIIGKDFLETLKNCCDTVLLDNSKAEDIFPNESISFYDYDDIFFNKLSYLSKRLNQIISSPKFNYLTFYYSYSC